MPTIFDKDMVTIPQSKYEELIRTSQKYEILFSMVQKNFEDVFNDIWEQLKNIDFNKFNKIKEEK